MRPGFRMWRGRSSVVRLLDRHSVTVLPARLPLTTHRLSALARTTAGSSILRIAADVAAMRAEGHEILNFTIGDFAPAQFPVPPSLAAGIAAALAAGQTQYSPAAGLPALREAVAGLYRRSFQHAVTPDQVLVTSGARPGLYLALQALVDPGDRVVYPVPSWNVEHYCHQVGAMPVPVQTTAADRFQLSLDELRLHLRNLTVRAVVLCSPSNPAGTTLSREWLAEAGRLILAANAERAMRNARPVYLLYDQSYWMLTRGEVEPLTPVQILPELAAVTITVDGLSKNFAATGVRVGWTTGPEDVIQAMTAANGHLGAWAGRAEQAAAAALLNDEPGIAAYLSGHRGRLEARLGRLHAGLSTMGEQGLPVEVLAPDGAIYLSVRLAIQGWRTPEGNVLHGDDHIQAYLLGVAQVAVVPFSAFGLRTSAGWVRLSVGTVDLPEIDQALSQIHRALARLEPPT